ncbi:MAG TPA: PLDc N-terminal domain-containing protein [Pilimelia sp.]|nr:PLDc N-terminal domain-containing protein [Pilimelia sp.]
MTQLVDVLRRNRAAAGMARRRRWRDLSDRQRAAMLVVASIELALTATAAADLYRRPSEQVLGRKALWWPVLVVQPFGPVAYLMFGRRRAG